MSSKAYKPPTIEELAEKYKGANICVVSQGPTAHRNFEKYTSEEVTPGEPWYIWTQNGGWKSHITTSLGFVMDDLHSEIWGQNTRYTKEEIHNVVKDAGIPIITARAYPEFSTLVEFPMEWAWNELPRPNGRINFNETINYMIALGILFKVNRMDFWGADYRSPDGKGIRADKRACCEFWLGMAAMSGIQIRTYHGSDLLRYPIARPGIEMEGVYGYEQDNLPPEILKMLDLDENGGAKIKVGNGR